jgi:hypothetical protein
LDPNKSLAPAGNRKPVRSARTYTAYTVQRASRNLQALYGTSDFERMKYPYIRTELMS